MEYLTEPEPPRFTRLPVAPGISRMVAPNPGPMTYHGTNTWLVETAAGLVVIDPGPAEAAHVAALVAAAGPIAHILLTHGHADHSGAVPALEAAAGAPVSAWPDLAESEEVAGLRVLPTPGHARDHLCFAHASGHLFSGDHVMGWSSSIVAPPDGDMSAYLASLEKLLGRDDHTYLPGHGPPIPAPRAHVAALRAHRLVREADILGALGRLPQDLAALRARLYPALAPRLAGAAERTLLAHLEKLAREGKVRRGAGGGWQHAGGSPGA